jgi:hypothetical protein
MDDYPDLIRALERAANGRRRIVDITADDAAAQRRRTPEWFAESTFGDLRELHRILHVPSHKQAISNLPFDAFVRVA